MTKDEAIEMLGSEMYKIRNEEVRQLLIAFAKLANCRSHHVVMNAGILLGLAAMCADGSSVEDALTVIRQAWKEPAVQKLAAYFKTARKLD